MRAKPAHARAGLLRGDTGRALRVLCTQQNAPASSSREHGATGHLKSSDERLTPVELHTLVAITAWIRRRGTSPTLRELSGIIDVTYEGARLRIDRLVAKRYIERLPRSSRTLRIIRDHAVVRLRGMP